MKSKIEKIKNKIKTTRNFKETIIIIILTIIGLVGGFNYIFSDKGLYKISWNINIPNPESKTIIYDTFEFQDGEIFEILHYNNKKIMKLIKNLDAQKIEGKTKEELMKRYNYLTDYDSRSEKYISALSNTLQDKFNSDNYYFCIEESSMGELGYRLLLMIIDTKENNVYSIQYIS